MAIERVITVVDAKERVAFELTEKIMSRENVAGKTWSRKEILDLYAECLYATSGYREYR